MNVHEHDPSWAARFEQERRRLAAVFAPWLGAERIEQVGSTSVPGLKAKPIVADAGIPLEPDAERLDPRVRR